MSEAIIQLAGEIATALDEPKVGEVRRIIHTIGLERARALLIETKSVMANGGMKTRDGSRDRTAGGVWFYLLKEQVSEEEFRALFPYKFRQSVPLPSRLPWGHVPKYVAGLSKLAKGELHKVQLKVIGKPKGAAKTKDGECMVVMVEGAPVPPTLPRGIPAPPAQSQAVAVFICMAQWARVVEDLKNPTSNLRVHGYPVFNPKNGTTVLLAETVDIVKRKRKGEPGDTA